MAIPQEIVLSVPDVSCEHCVKTINGALGVLSGVKAVSTDIATKSVTLSYDSDQLSLQQIEATLDDAGYTVSQEPVQTPRTTGKPLNLL
ncbi:heavy-metal-associated domain-containing protein [Tengunoibacter tsumagoiensis]|uniref:Copper chaperone CopZ n=1 Tax=Tengunoibacter tsumagoiensis TaxID=2014871 RepID=A0A401ZUM8_9CHLR|nr:cation transporter [Tengunoibacter tsumagoiensis]GCE10601.1 copper chaperone CopZ [Tengunoibacter tsumagoiensis]